MNELTSTEKEVLKTSPEISTGESKEPRGGRGSKGDPASIRESLQEATKTEETPEMSLEKAEQEKETLLRELARLRVREAKYDQERLPTEEILKSVREVQKKLFQINRRLPNVDPLADQKRVRQMMETIAPAPTPQTPAPVPIETPPENVAPRAPVAEEVIVPAETPRVEMALPETPIPEEIPVVVTDIQEPIKEEVSKTVTGEAQAPVAAEEVAPVVPETQETTKEEPAPEIPATPETAPKEVPPAEPPATEPEVLRGAYEKAMRRLQKNKEQENSAQKTSEEPVAKREGAPTPSRVPGLMQAPTMMPQEIVPVDPQILAVAVQTLNGDMDTLFTTPGFLGLGSKKGSESAHWKDHRVGFARQSVEGVLNMGRDSFPSDNGRHFGIEDPVATRKMKNYLMQVSQQAGMIADPGEKIADYIKRAVMSLVIRSLNK
ncbi:MAG: hypothetical protein PHS95_00745 [Candidatus Pacebacteria bacterium]|nr:hypothetical protein [Candidatus Paceibacterota bacterium]